MHLQTFFWCNVSLLPIELSWTASHFRHEKGLYTRKVFWLISLNLCFYFRLFLCNFALQTKPWNRRCYVFKPNCWNHVQFHKCFVQSLHGYFCPLLTSVIQTFYYGNDVGCGYSQNFYLNKERKITWKLYQCLCLWESVCGVCKDRAAALHFPEWSSLLVLLWLLRCMIKLTLTILQCLHRLI